MGCTRADITGMRFGYLTAVAYVGDHEYPSGKKLSMWKCKCDCGNETIVPLSSLRTGNTKSCGCNAIETRRKFQKSLIKHGEADSRLYVVWEQMKKRCKNPKDRSYRYYGANGVSVCEEWDNDYGAFREWAIQNGYERTAKRGQCTLDRINPFGNYEPDNCRWITQKEQLKNLRRHWKGSENNHGRTDSHALEAAQ